MKKLILIMLLLPAALWLQAQTVHYSQTIKGVVIDEQSGNVIGNVTVILESNSSIASITDSLGSFKL